MAPKSSGRIVPYEGLPPGWQAIEKDYLTGTMAGKCYIRFQNETHKGVGSIRGALKLYAADNGLDPDEVLRDYDRQKDEQKRKGQADRASKGFLQGEKRDEAVEVFRSRFGKLDGATICALPGWRGESKILEKSGQICARYYAPDGQSYALVLNIEALFGLKLMNGEDIPDIDAARASLVYDAKGKVINQARRENVASEFTLAPEQPAKKKRYNASPMATEIDYRPSEFLKVFRLRTKTSSQQIEAEKVPDEERVVSAAEQVHDLLVARGFRSDTELLFVTGRRTSRTVNGKLLDALNGIYHQRPDKVGDRPYFQKIFTGEINSNTLGCEGFCISWSEMQSVWKIGHLDENKAGFAVNRQDAPHPANLDLQWELYEPKVQAQDAEDGSGADQDDLE